MPCSTACVDTTLIPTTGNCDLQPRIRGIDRIGFYLCNTDLPQPFTCAAIEAMVEAGSLVFSSRLANVVRQDPETETLTMADCIPPIEQVSQRIIEFEDRFPVDIAGGGSPYETPEPYQNYTFWNDKKNKNSALRYLFLMCDGSVQVPRDRTGDPLEGSVFVFVADTKTTGTTPQTQELIKGRLTFKGDPFDLGNKPELDASGEVFDMSDCNIGF